MATQQLPIDIQDRILNKASPEPNSGCWLWLGALQSGGYGSLSFRINRKSIRMGAHRISYIVFRGKIPPGLQIDHLCKVRCCVNPDHLEPVTGRENVLRGNTLPAANLKKTHCPKGHLYEGKNLHLRADGARRCKQCNRMTSNKYAQTHREILRERARIYYAQKGTS